MKNPNEPITNRCVKIYTEDLDKESFDIIKEIAILYSKTKNKFYQNYSGINSIQKVKYSKKVRKEIRDELVKKVDKNNNVTKPKMQARFWKLALDECGANIRTNWSNAKNEAKSLIFANENFNEGERHYIFYMFKSDEYLYKIFNKINFDIPEVLLKYDINKHKLNKYIRRILRKTKTSIPKCKKNRGFSLDTDMYSIKDDILYIMTNEAFKRLAIKLKGNVKPSGTIKIVINDLGKVEIHTTK